MKMRSTAVAVAVLGLLLGAVPADAAVRASGELRRVSTTSYELVVNNIGDQPISAIGFVTASGVTPTSARTSGGECTVQLAEEDNSFDCRNFAPIEPGKQRVFGFGTTGPYPAGAGGVRWTYPVDAMGIPRAVVTGPAGPPVGGRSG